MKVISKDKTINLDSFDTIEYKESIFGPAGGYPVQAKKTMPGGMFGGIQIITEELVRLNYEKNAKMLVQDITEAWINEKKFFDINQWIKSH